MGIKKTGQEGPNLYGGGPIPDTVKTLKQSKKTKTPGKKSAKTSDLGKKKNAESTYRKKPQIREDLFKNRPEIRKFLNQLLLIGNDRLRIGDVIDKIGKKNSTPSTRLGGSRKENSTGTPKLKSVKGSDGKTIKTSDGSRHLGPSKFVEERNNRPKTYFVRDYNHPYYHKDDKKGAPPKIPVTED